LPPPARGRRTGRAPRAVALAAAPRAVAARRVSVLRRAGRGGRRGAGLGARAALRALRRTLDARGARVLLLRRGAPRDATRPRRPRTRPRVARSVLHVPRRAEALRGGRRPGRAADGARGADGAPRRARQVRRPLARRDRARRGVSASVTR